MTKYLPFNKISTFIESQFPEFYHEDGPVFIQFVKTYYEWLETTNQVLNVSENLLSYRDIDDTLDAFLAHFQKEYLYGVSLITNADRRFIIKHILDLYRAKGTEQGAKLLFRLIFNTEADIYLPSKDLFRPSDNIWYAPQFLEVTESALNKTFPGKRIKGSRTGVEAIVEAVVTQVVNEQIITILYISNMTGGQFRKGEKVIDIDNFSDIATLRAPRIKGSVYSIQLISGGQGFNVGDILVPKNAAGRDAELKVTEVRTGTGTLLFSIEDGGTFFSVDAEEVISRRGPIGFVTVNSGGTGYSNSDTFIVVGDQGAIGATGTLKTNGSGVIQNTTVISAGSGYFPQNTSVVITTSGGTNANLTANVTITGRGAAFDIGGIASVQPLTYAEDFIFEYMDTRIDAADYEFQPSLTDANTIIADALTFHTKYFGTLKTLTNIATGNNYIAPPKIVVRDIIYSSNLDGMIYYSNSSYEVTGYNTEFLHYFEPNDFVKLTADTFGTNTELRQIRSVVNNTSMILDDKPLYNSPGGVTSVTVTGGGTGYSNSSTVTFTPQSITRRNFLAYSEQFGQSGTWARANVGISNNAIANPIDGSVTVEKLTYNTSANVHMIVQDTYNNSGNLAFSVYVKAAELDRVTLFMDDSAGNSFACDYNLTTLERNYTSYDAAEWLGVRARMYPAANGFYRCVLQAEKDSITMVRVGIALSDGESFNANGVASFAGANTTAGIYIYGAQIESAVTATPYMATTTSNTTVVDSPGSGASANVITNGSGVIVSVVMSNTGSDYYGYPTVTASGGSGATLTPVMYFAGYEWGTPALLANFTESFLTNPLNGSLGSTNETIVGIPQYGTGIIASAEVKSSGLGYRDNEFVEFGTAGAVETVSVVSPGSGYANDDPLIFSGGGFSRAAAGYVVTDGSGVIIDVLITYYGSGYQTPPTVSVLSTTGNGNGAVLSATIGGLNTTYRITGNLIKLGVGKQKGQWLNTRSFPSVDKYLQDSYYYQEFSYEVQVSMALNRYVTMLKKIFHPSGLELFGKFVYKDTVQFGTISDTFIIESNLPEYLDLPSIVDTDGGDILVGDILEVDTGTWV